MDDENDRKISDEELDQFCHDNAFIGWFTTSAKTGLNIKKGMNFMITKVMKNKKKLDKLYPENDIKPKDTINLNDKKIFDDNITNNNNNTNNNSSNNDQNGCGCYLL